MGNVSIRDVSKAAGVSVTTVSHALSEAHQSRVNPKTRQHVREVAAQLGYSPNRLASGLRNKRSYLLGLVADQIASTPFAGDMILGAQDAARERGWTLMLVDSGGNRSLEERQLKTLLQHQADGIIYAKMYHQQIQVPHDIPTGTPVVLLDAFDPEGQYSSVVPDELGAARTAVNELTNAGHRRIGFINNSDDIPATVGRLQGYREGLAAARIGFDPELVTRQMPDATGGRQGSQILFRNAEPPTALFCFNDAQALGAYQTANRVGLSVPGDLSVVSIDNFEIISDGLWPGLTSVALPHYGMGRWAVRRLLDEIEYLEPGAREQISFDCPIVRRGSVAPPQSSPQRSGATRCRPAR